MIPLSPLIPWSPVIMACIGYMVIPSVKTKTVSRYHACANVTGNFTAIVIAEADSEPKTILPTTIKARCATPVTSTSSMTIWRRLNQLWPTWTRSVANYANSSNKHSHQMVLQLVLPQMCRALLPQCQRLDSLFSLSIMPNIVQGKIWKLSKNELPLMVPPHPFALILSDLQSHLNPKATWAQVASWRLQAFDSP